MKNRNLVLLLLACFCWLNAAQAATYIVMSTADSGPNTLRAAILLANANPGADVIEFNIGTGQQSITVLSTLVISEGLTIDGETQPGWTSSPIIKIGENFNGDVLFANGTGPMVFKSLDVSKTGSTIGSDVGLSVQNTSDVTIHNCWAKNRKEIGIAMGNIVNLTFTGNDLTNSGSGGSVAVRFYNISGTLTAHSNVFGGTTSVGLQLLDMNNFTIGATSGDIQVGTTGLKEIDTPMYIGGGSNLTVTGLDLGRTSPIKKGIGIIVSNSANFTATQNKFVNHQIGIDLGNGTGNSLSANITCNSFRDNDHGLRIINVNGNAVFVNNNSIYANGSGIFVSPNTTPPIDATNNWWGSAAGPGAGGNNGVVGNPTTSPFLNIPPGCAPVVDNDYDGYVFDDCDDNNAAVHPGGAENCANNVDENCDGYADKTFSASVAKIDVVCFGGNGSATVSCSKPQFYDFAWSSSGGTRTHVLAPQTFALPAGTYTVTVTNVCATTTKNVTISGPPSALSVNLVKTNITCFGLTNGKITATRSGGWSGAATYSWSTTPPATTNIIQNLPAGPYTVTLTDSKGCSATNSATVVEPTQVTLSYTISGPNSLGKYTVVLAAAGGTPYTTGLPHRYCKVNATGGCAFSSTTIFGNLNAGTTYEFRTRDLNVCTAAIFVTPPFAPDGSDDRTGNTSFSGAKILPNPNAGQFEVALPATASGEMFLKIVNLAGCTVFEKQADAGSDRQTIHAETLPPGLYFLQAVSEGKLLGVEKFVKQ